MPKKTAWVSTTVAAFELGCSKDFLLSHRNRLFKLGKHYKVLDPHAYRKTYRWHLNHCQRLMAQSADQSD